MNPNNPNNGGMTNNSYGQPQQPEEIRRMMNEIFVKQQQQQAIAGQQQQQRMMRAQNAVAVQAQQQHQAMQQPIPISAGMVHHASSLSSGNDNSNNTQKKPTTVQQWQALQQARITALKAKSDAENVSNAANMEHQEAVLKAQQARQQAQFMRGRADQIEAAISREQMQKEEEKFKRKPKCNSMTVLDVVKFQGKGHCLLSGDDSVDIANLAFPFQTKKSEQSAQRKKKKKPLLVTPFQSKPTVSCRNLIGPNHLSNTIPTYFPPNLVFRALASYSLLRTLSLKIHLSPFTPYAFLRALSLKMSNTLISEVHVALLRLLYAQLCGKHIRKRIGKFSAPFSVPGNEMLDRRDWNHLDNMTWPVFCCDYSDMTAHQFDMGRDDDLKCHNGDYDALSDGELSASEVFGCTNDPDADDNEIEADKEGLVSDDDGGKSTKKKSTKRKINTNDASSAKRSKHDDPTPLAGQIKQNEITSSCRADQPQRENTSSIHTPQSALTSASLSATVSSLDDVNSAKPIMGDVCQVSNTGNIAKRLPATMEGNGTASIRRPKPREILRNTSQIDSNDDCAEVAVKHGKKEAIVLSHAHHLEAIKLLRTTYYHELPIENKLDMLEFLLDELLQSSPISTEFTTRDSSHEDSGIFGTPPTEMELTSIRNVDDCVVCGGPGELVCCDGCANAFHRRCASLPTYGDLPGKWLCAECSFPDPAKFGSLYGKPKSKLDWFRLSDVLSSPDQPPPEIGSSNDNLEFLIVHGFVFTRKNTASFFPNPPLPLSKEQVWSLLQSLGPLRCSKWPFSQIPHNPVVIWPPAICAAVPQQYFKSASSYYLKYVDAAEFFNPTCYANAYRHGPYPPKLNVLPKRFSEHGFIDEDLLKIGICGKLIYYSDPDSLVCRSNRYECLKSVKDYMIRLEKQLRRSYLLSELWDATPDDDSWESLVVNAKSPKYLAQLFVKLIDAAHVRSFVEDWVSSAHHPKKSEERADKGYAQLSEGWTAAAERKSRAWIRSVNVCRFDDGTRQAMRTNRKGKVKEDPKPAQGAAITLPHAKEVMAQKAGMAEELINGANNEESTFIQGHDIFPVTESDANIMKNSSSGGNVDLMSGRNGEAAALNNGKTELNSDDRVKAEISKQSKIVPRPCNHIPVLADDNSTDLIISKDTGSVDKANSKVIQSAADRKVSDTSKKDAILSPQECEVKIENASEKKKGKRKRASKKKASTAQVKNRRRSGRVKSRNITHDEIGSQTSNMNVAQHIGGNFFSSETTERDMKVAALQNLVEGPFEKEMIWQICGRMLYPPTGNLSLHATRVLGRRAGCIAAPFLLYSDKFEVAQPSTGYIWRKDTLSCRTLQELAIQIRIIDELVNKPVLHTCENMGRRTYHARAAIQKVIKCIQRDEQTGQLEYFLYNKGKHRGCWMSDEKVDLSALILERSIRIDERKRLSIQRVAVREKKEKEEERARNVAAQKAKAMEVAKANAQKAMEHAQFLSTVAIKKGETSSLALAALNAAVANATTSEKDMQEHAPPSLGPSNLEVLRLLAAKITTRFKEVLQRHQGETVELLRESARLKLGAVPAERMNKVRLANLAILRAINEEVQKRFGDKRCLTEQALTQKLAKFEQDGVQQYIKETEQQRIAANRAMIHSNHTSNIQTGNGGPIYNTQQTYGTNWGQEQQVALDENSNWQGNLNGSHSGQPQQGMPLQVLQHNHHVPTSNQQSVPGSIQTQLGTVNSMPQQNVHGNVQAANRQQHNMLQQQNNFHLSQNRMQQNPFNPNQF